MKRFFYVLSLFLFLAASVAAQHSVVDTQLIPGPYTSSVVDLLNIEKLSSENSRLYTSFNQDLQFVLPLSHGISSTDIYQVGLTYTGCGSSLKKVKFMGSSVPLSYGVAGGGAFCEDQPGKPVRLSGSQPGIFYQLERDGIPVGEAVSGTGDSLSFGVFSINGTYTVSAIDRDSGCKRTWRGPGASSIHINPAVAGVGVSSLIYSYANEYGCSSSDSVLVNVMPAPSLSVSGDLLPHDGDSVVLSVSGVFDSVLWYKNNSVILQDDGLSIVVYDRFGRDSVSFLSYSSFGSPGSLPDNPVSDLLSIYSSPPAGVSADSHPYAVSVFEYSPLNRIVEQGVNNDFGYYIIFGSAWNNRN